jgi:ATP-binding cassette subfamily B protein
MRHKTAFAGAYLASLALHLLALVTPLFFQAIIDPAIAQRDSTALIVLTAAAAGFVLLEAIFSLGHDYVFCRSVAKIDQAISVDTFRHLCSLPISFFHGSRSGSLAYDVEQGEKIRDFLTHKLFFSVTELTALAIFLPVLLIYSPTLALTVLAFSCAIALSSAALSGRFQARLSRVHAGGRERQAHLTETLSGIDTIKSLGLEERQQSLWESRSADYLKEGRDFQWLCSKARALTVSLDKLMTIAVIAVGAMLVFRDALTLGQLVAVQMLATRVSGPLLQLIGLIQAFQQARVSARMLGEVMDSAPEAAPEQELARPAISGAIEVSRLSFRYAEGLPDALRDVGFSVKAGEVVGVVGMSGSGKSTLVRLLQGLMAPQRGSILVDGVDLQDIDRAHLRRHIGVVPQEGFLFNATIAENIVAGQRDCSIDDVRRVCDVACVTEFVQRLPDGLDTRLGEGAYNLSGGQRQRIAIARALLRDPAILIFDEATSALDLESEGAIQDRIWDIIYGRTAFFVTHRIASLGMADRVLALEDGAVAGFGSHRELLRDCAIYRQLWTRAGAALLPVAAE